jgi:hypothetical protein
MSLHRIGLMAITTLFTASLTSMASAGCCDWGGPSQPVAYASSAYAGGCGGCGSAAYASPIVYAASSGCGGCGTAAYAAPVTYAAPMAYASGCGGCGARAVVYAQPTVIAPSPIYVVNQGPQYSGPGIMVPYRTYSSAAYAAPADDYPYVEAPRPRYHHPVWRGPRVVYRDRVIYRERQVPVQMAPAHRRWISPRG